jgi:nitroreductase
LSTEIALNFMSAVLASASGSTDIDVFQRVARQRRSIYSYRDTPVSRQVVERAIDCAVLAPNHHRTHPWRFFVFAADARNRLAAAYETAARRLGRDAERAVQRAMDAPVMVVIGCVAQTSNPRVERNEEEFAVAASVENMMLAFAAEGVGTLLTTGVLAESDEVHRLVGLTPPDARVMGVVNVGYRDTERPLLARPLADGASVTRWIDAA